MTHQPPRGFVAQMPPCRSFARAVGWTLPDTERLEHLGPLPLLPVAPLLGGCPGCLGLEG